MDAIISRLETSLSEALRAFYPLAGRLRLTPGTAERYGLYYRPGDAVTFTVAEYDHDVDSLATHDAREVARLAPLLLPLPKDGKLLALQATILSGRRGLAIGMAVHHAACDGTTLTHFRQTWAQAALAACAGTGGARQEALPPVQPPVIDRTVVPDPRGLYDVFCQAKPTSDELEFVKMAPDQLLATFTLCRDDLQRVKDVVAATRGVVPPRCSSLVATMGLVWSCYMLAKKASGNNDGSEGRTCLLFPVDHRSRMKPPIPDKYLGSCVGPGFAIASTDELTVPGAGGIFTACTGFRV